jgi:hypothetical protein
MLNFKVQLSKGRTVYTKILKNGDLEALSAQEMYTTMQKNKNVKHFKAPILLFGVLIFVFLGLSVILFEDAPSLFLFLNAYMFLAFFCYLGKAIFLRKRSKAQRTNVEYDIDSDGKKRMNTVKEAFDYVNTAVTVFPSAGLHSIIFLDTNIDIYGWTDPTDKDEIFFMPDVCLVNVKQAGLCAIEYNKMHSVLTDSIDTTRYPPSDSEILGETWLHARTNGQPDKRYTNNPKVYSIKQGFTLISDNTNLTDNKETNFSAGLIISSLSIAKGFTSKMKKIFSDSNEAETKPKDANPKTKDANPETKEVQEHSKVSHKSMLPFAELFKAEKDIEALNSIFEKSHSLWIENLNKISKVNYIMFCEAPPFDESGSVSNYIYDRNGEAKGMFLKAPYKALKGVVETYPPKGEMIDFLNEKGFLFLDVLPLSISFSPKRNTKKYEDFLKYFWNGHGADLDFSEFIVQSRLHEMKDKISDDLRVCFALKSISMVVNSLDNSNLILGDKTIHIHEDLVGLNTAGQPGVTEITNAFKSSVLK